MKKLKNESALFKKALAAGMKDAEGRKAAEFGCADSVSQSFAPVDTVNTTMTG